MSPLEIYREAYRAGYFYGRIDADRGAPYDDRTVLERKGALMLSEGNAVNNESNENNSAGLDRTGNGLTPQ